MAEMFETEDSILRTLELSDPTKIKIDISQDTVNLYIGPRDWSWSRLTGELIGSGTVVTGRTSSKTPNIPTKPGPKKAS